MQKTNGQINNDIYNQYGHRWYTAFDDPVALLRAESKLKTPWVLDKISQYFPKDETTKVLDVGCGAGFLSNQMSLSGLSVTGADLSASSLEVAKAYDKTQKVTYIEANAYKLPFADQSFDVVTAMDFLEHVDDPEQAVKEFSRVLKPGGVFIFHTFNRNFLAYIVIIKLVEWLVKNTPKDMHVLKLFIKPEELTQYCQNQNMKVNEMIGIKPVFSKIPFKNLFTGFVPENLKFKLTKSLKLSYMGYAVKSK